MVREGNKVHVYMTAIRSHFSPDNIEGIKMGDEVYFHVTNLEQDWDVPHGFAVKGTSNSINNKSGCVLTQNDRFVECRNQVFTF